MLLATIQLTLLRITYPTYNTVAQGGGDSHIKRMGVPVKNFENIPYEVPRCCFVDMALNLKF